MFKMVAVRHLGIVLPPYKTTHEVSCWNLLAAAACQISRQCDTQIYLNFFAYLAWNAYSGPQNGGFRGLSTSKCDYLSSRLPKRPSLHKSTSFKLSTVKIRSRGLTCRRVGRKCDGHTLYTHENLYSVHAQHWTDNKHSEVLITNIN